MAIRGVMDRDNYSQHSSTQTMRAISQNMTMGKMQLSVDDSFNLILQQKSMLFKTFCKAIGDYEMKAMILLFT